MTLETLPWEDCPEEYRFGMNGTAWRLFCCAVHLFAENDYSSISIRSIAEEVGIKAASIYNHFSSKEALLDRMFEYTEYFSDAYETDLDELLIRAETEPPREFLFSTHYYYPDPLQPIMSRLLLICYKQMRSNPRADAIFRWIIIERPRRIIVALLTRMVELGRIEPLDIEGFAELYVNNYYGAALRMHSSHPVEGELWVRAFTSLFKVIIPTD